MARDLVIIRHELAEVDSTNTHARTLAQQGAPEGTLVFAHAQTAGRGRHGNTWQGLSGNLFCSIILRPAVSAADVGQLSFLIAVALADTIAALLPDPAQLGLKWPNDILIGGRKCAGILLESEAAAGQGHLPWVVAGLGVNLAAAPEGAVCLAELTGKSLAPATFLDLLEPRLRAHYLDWQAEGFAPIQQAWTRHALNRGQDIRVRLTRETLTGIFEGIDGQGALNLRLPDGSLRQIASGEVYL